MPPSSLTEQNPVFSAAPSWLPLVTHMPTRRTRTPSSGLTIWPSSFALAVLSSVAGLCSWKCTTAGHSCSLIFLWRFAIMSMIYLPCSKSYPAEKLTSVPNHLPVERLARHVTTSCGNYTHSTSSNAVAHGSAVRNYNNCKKTKKVNQGVLAGVVLVSFVPAFRGSFDSSCLLLDLPMYNYSSRSLVVG